MTHSDFFRQIETLVPTLHGWCSPERACELATAILTLRPLRSVSIGIWAGRDTLSMALAHQFLNHGKVLAIDPYSAEASTDGETEENAAWWRDQGMHDQMAAAFQHQAVKLGLEEFIEFKRSRSDDVPPPQGVLVAAIDGNHSDQAVRDVDRFVAPMPIGGIVYMDDEKWATGGVQRAIARLEQIGFSRQFSRDTGAFFIRDR